MDPSFGKLVDQLFRLAASSGNTKVRLKALDTLNHFFKYPGNWIDRLISLLDDEERKIRKTSARVLSRLRPEAAVYMKRMLKPFKKVAFRTRRSSETCYTIWDIPRRASVRN